MNITIKNTGSKHGVKRFLRLGRPALLACLAALLVPKGSFAEPIAIGEGFYIGWAPFYVADAKKFWQKEGLTPSVYRFPSGRLTLESVLAGKTLIGTAAETPAVFAALAGRPVRALAVLNHFQDFQLVADRTIKSLGGFKGKRIGFSSGTNSQYILSLLLKQNGLSPSDVIPINLKPTDFAAAISNHSIDAFIWGEPMISQALALSPGRLHVFTNPVGYYSYSLALTTQDDIEKRRGTLVKALRALAEASRFIQKHPKEALAIVSKAISLDPRVAKPIVYASLRQPLSLDAHGLAAAQVLEARWAIAEKLAPEGAPIPDFRNQVIVPDLLRQALGKP